MFRDYLEESIYDKLKAKQPEAIMMHFETSDDELSHSWLFLPFPRLVQIIGGYSHLLSVVPVPF